jgi:hypothetical protein
VKDRLRQSALGAGHGALLPVLPLERLFALEHVSATMDRHPLDMARSLLPTSTSESDRIDGLSPAALRRALDRIWGKGVPRGVVAAVLEGALAQARRSCDRAIIEAYLVHYPDDHADFALLRDTARTAADRHAWGWRTIGREHRLWDEDALDRCARACRAATETAAFVRGLGLIGRLASGRFATLMTE